ncbi:hypothetical protein Tco_0567496 [Tanacetum coccineum]
MSFWGYYTNRIFLDLKEMAPKEPQGNTQFTENHTSPLSPMYQLQAMIDQGTEVCQKDRTCARECTYQGLLKVPTSVFQKATEGCGRTKTNGLKRMETVFRISNCSVENQIKFSTCTLLAGALTWKRDYEAEVMELWNLKVKGTDVTGYNQRFQELALLCVRMFPEESDKVERYVGGLPDMIHESVVASKPKTIQEATEIATELMDKKISTFAERQAENKRKLTTSTKLNNNFTRGRNVGQLTRCWDGEEKCMLRLTAVQQVQIQLMARATVK